MDRLHRIVARYGLLIGLLLLGLGVFGTVAGKNDEKITGLSISIAGLALVLAGRR